MKPYYDRGGIVIYHADYRDVLSNIPRIGLTLTDPPYGVGISYASYRDELTATTEMVVDFVKSMLPHSDIVALTAGKWDTELELYRTLPPRWRMCWYKGSQSTASPIGFNDWEAILIYGDKVHRNAHDYFYAMPEKMGAFGHPCPKPIKFCNILVSRLARKGDVVLDPFMGSGTTLVAAKQLGYPAIGIEIEEKYCEIAAQRLSQEVMEFDFT